jgi:DNA-binding response OmpR family regulator
MTDMRSTADSGLTLYGPTRTNTESTFSLILIDSGLLDIDGDTLTAEIRKRDRRVGIIGMTADALEESRARCLEAGLDDCLSRPLQADQLGRVMECWRARQNPDLAAAGQVRSRILDAPVATPNPGGTRDAR